MKNENLFMKKSNYPEENPNYQQKYIQYLFERDPFEDCAVDVWVTNGYLTISRFIQSITKWNIKRPRFSDIFNHDKINVLKSLLDRTL